MAVSKKTPVANASTEADTPRPTPLGFQAVRSTRAFEEIATQIRHELAQGRLKIGDRLPSERALSEQFGVSRNTLREALRSLEYAGLVRLQKGATGGAFISEGSAEAINTSLLDMYHVGSIQPGQLTEARIWLESIIVREACLRARPEDIETLRANVREAEKARAEGDDAHRAEIHLEFHRILARMTQNPVMVIVMNGVLAVLNQFVQSIGSYENAFVVPSRKRFLKHMAARDVEAAVAEMESSLKRLKRNYLSLIGPDSKATPAQRAVRNKRTAPRKTA